MGVFIGRAAEQTGVKVPTIRYYEEIGLLRPADRSGSNRRLFDAGDISRLGFIRPARELGFEIDAIATERLIEVRRRIVALRALETELDRMLDSCSHGLVGDCRVIDALNPPPAHDSGGVRRRD